MIGFELSPTGTTSPPDPVPLAAFFRPGGGNAVALAEGYNNGVAVWTEVAPDFAACLMLDNDDPSLRLSWRETLIARLRNVYPIGQFTLSGSWGQMQSSGSGLSGSYTGNRAVSTGSLTATANVTVSRGSTYDVWVHYTARTSGGYVKVEIDGSQALVNEIGDPGSLGFKAFSSYGAIDLQRRQTVKVASGLTGPHAMTISYGGVATPGGNAIMIEAVSTSADLSDGQILPPLWQPNTPYEMGDEVQMGGLYYAARANGTSGVLGPLHSSGIASDGALDWRADFRPTYPEFVALDYLRRGVFERAGLYDTSYSISGDYDGMLRFLTAGNVHLAYLPKVMVQMKMGGVSNRSFAHIMRKSREDYRAIRRNHIGGIATLVSKNVSKLGQFRAGQV